MVELDSNGKLTRSEVAAFFREFADELDDAAHRTREGVSSVGEEEVADEDALEARRVPVIIGGDSATVTLPNALEFDVDVESRSPMFGSTVHQEIEFELSWEIEDPDEGLVDDRMKIE